MLARAKDPKLQINDLLFQFFKYVERSFHEWIEVAIKRQLTNLGDYERMLSATLSDSYK